MEILITVLGLIWGLFFLTGIICNADGYTAADWVAIIAIAVCPYIIGYLIHCRKKKVRATHSMNESDIVKSSPDLQQTESPMQTEQPVAPTVQPSNDIHPIAPDYVYSGNLIYRSDGKEISEKEIPYLIEASYRKQQFKNYLHEKNATNLFAENNLSIEEKFFFIKVYEEFTVSGLEPNLVSATRLGSGTFNVEYIPQGYLGKVRISGAKETFRVIKRGNKRATRIFESLNEAEQFISGRLDYIIERKGSPHTYFIQYFIGQKLHADYCPNLQSLISLIPRWAKYVRYMERYLQ